MIGEREYVVPCGKCEECTNKKQAEFGALALHAALKADSLVFITFTYRNDMCPVAFSEETVFRSEDGEVINRDVRVIGFERGCDPWLDSNGHFMNGVRPQFMTNPQVCVSCSLYREDIKNALKEFRREWKKTSGEAPHFSYAVFGEYGEHHGRPHYHGLFFGLTPPMVKMFTDIWNRRFGFTCVIPPCFNRKLSLDEIVAVTRYTSKYISKGVCTRWVHLLPYVEKPRRQSSLNFGDFSQEEISQLSDFYLCRDLLQSGFGLSDPRVLERFLSRRQTFSIAGNLFPIPQRLKEKIFYEPDDIKSRLGALRAASPTSKIKQADLVRGSRKKCPIYVMADTFARHRDNDNITQQLRKDSSSDTYKVNRRILQAICDNEKNSLQSRKEIAEKNILTNLQKSKI